MRIDITVRSAAGTHDVAVHAPPGTTWAAVRNALTRAIPGADPRWCGRRALDPQLALGLPPLVHGAVLGERRAGTTDGVRLEVIGGRDAGAALRLDAPVATIGRDRACELVLDDQRVSRRHALVTSTRAGITVRDLRSTHGIWVGGLRVDAAPVAADTVVRVGDSFLALPSTPGTPLVTVADGSGHLVVAGQAAPASIPPAPIHVPVALTVPDPDRPPVLAAVLPALLGVGLAVVIGSWEFLAFALLAPVTALGTSLGARRRTRRRSRREAAAHRRAVEVADAELAAGLAAELARRRSGWPGPASVRRIAATPTDRLWTGEDGLRIRVGLGTAESRLQAERSGELTPAGLLPDVPVTVDLADGWLGIAGPPHAREGPARWLVAQLAARNSPADLGLALLVDDLDAWRWVRWLPHLRGDPGAGAVLVADAHLVRSAGPDVALAIVFADRLADLPARCTQRIELTACRARVDTGSGCEHEAVADAVTVDWAERLARTLAPLRRPAAPAQTGVPAHCRLLDLTGAGDLSAHAVRTRWATSTGAATTVLGIGAGGPVEIDLDRDGPHALVAGSTGSGKSHLLRCLVAGLALAHPPSHLSFLLIDFKGGAAFADCAQLPHTVGLVTDLDEHLTARVLAALDSEVRRRERLLAAAGAQDLKAYRDGPHTEALARLVVVIDEFAVLADELGGFVPGLVGIARRGRSLGLHLVLATQRPAGVVSPEIRANTALRICLRVTTAGESCDVIDVPAAAVIDPARPGRAFALLGGCTREFQTADVSGREAGTDDRVRVTVLDPWRRVTGAPEPAHESDLQRIVAAARSAAAVAPTTPVPHRPWLPPLPAILPYRALADVADRVPVGLVDLPAGQRQPPLAIDLAGGGAVVIAGRPRSGRTSAVRTIALAAAGRYPVGDLEIHAIDATGCGLADLRAVPHTGTVATVADGFELSARLVERLWAAGRRDVLTLLLVDGWDQLVAAAEEHDAGRTTERLLALVQRNAPTITTVVAGGRAALSPRLTALATSRVALALSDAGEYALAGVPTGAIPPDPPPGRGIRLSDNAQVQFALAPSPPIGPRGGAPRLRPLPARVERSALAARPGLVTLGVCGDEVVPMRLDLRGVRLLVVGPPRSGRSTLLQTVLAQVGDPTTVVVAPPRSPLAAACGRGLPGVGLVLLDDADLLDGTPTGDAVDGWLAEGLPGRAIVATARTDAVATSYRGLLARLRSERCGVVLHPGPGDADLFGIAVPRRRTPAPPGRGVVVPDPAWGLGTEPVAFQAALP